MNDNPGPCRCWTDAWSPHDGHCCFHRDSPEDCHDEAAYAQRRDRRRNRGPDGPMMERRYWLTEKGWNAVGGRSQ